MPASRAAPRPSFARLALRASLLAGALVDAGLAVLVVAYDRAHGASWPFASALLVRVAVQGLACYDRHRFDTLIPFVAGSLVLPLAVGLLRGSVEPWSIASAMIGGVQLLSHRIDPR